MIYGALSDIPPCSERAVIINLDTRVVSTLAVLSVLRHAHWPLLLIDCESTDGSWPHFRRLSEERGFDVLSAPRRPHGAALDWIFTEIAADRVLLVDSDLEIVDGRIVEHMRDWMADPRVFGAGFTHGPEWMDQGQWGFQHQDLGLYQERPWIPLAMLRTAHVRQALEAGHSFGARMVYNDLPGLPWISRMLYQRFRIPGLRKTRLKFLDRFRREYFCHKPNYVYYDTGADLYQYLKYHQDLMFAGLPFDVRERYATHFHGVTRQQLNMRERNATPLRLILEDVTERLATEYGLRIGSQ
jgi:glycosyltransferase involved in cell wall biosynthesis